MLTAVMIAAQLAGWARACQGVPTLQVEEGSDG
jgi:hypothetical protein